MEDSITKKPSKKPDVQVMKNHWIWQL